MDPSSVEPDPRRFVPERFAACGGASAASLAAGPWASRDHYGYGVGRRICPGIYLAERSMLLAMAKLLWAFRFKRAEGGGEIDSDVVTGYTLGLVLCPKDYPCRPVVRSEQVRETVEKELARARERVFSRFEEG